MKRIFRLFALWFLMGAVYFAIELIWRLPRGQLPHPAMWVVGGLCGVAVGAINQVPRYFNLPIIVQSVVGTVITLIVEFVSGVILNLWLGLGIWDYSHLWGNLYGQICILFAFAWLLLMPLCIWVEDRLRWGFDWNGRAYSLWSIYKDWITFK